MLKVPKAKPKGGGATDADLFDIVVCQVDHQIQCDPWSKGEGKNSTSKCKTRKEVKPVARCIDFDSTVWNAGATCIANHAHQDKHPQCSDKVTNGPAVAKVKQACKPVIKRETGKDGKTGYMYQHAPGKWANDNDSCKEFASALYEYY